jgi:hypothetical protein
VTPIEVEKPAAPAPQPKAVVAPRHVARPAPVQKKPEPPPAPKEKPVAPPKKEAPPPPPPRAAAPAPSAAGLKELEPKIDKMITTSPVTFDKQQLENCPLKCQLMFRYANGESFKGVFFKAAFMETLQSSSGTVRVVGRVKAEGPRYMIFVQGIK